MKFEDLEFFFVSDGVVHVDAGGPFGLVPRALYSRYLQPDEHNLIPMTLDCLLIRSQGKTILVDTGLGDRLSPRAQEQWGLERPQGGLINALARQGVQPEEVDIVINTHLHSDHCGGNTRDAEGEIIPTFPNAEYWVQWLEYSEASHPDSRTRNTYLEDNFKPLVRQDRLKLLTGDTPVTDQVRCVVTPGHTRGHQAVLLEVGDQKALYVADMASYAIHMARPAWVTSYDISPLDNIATKTRWHEWALQNDAWLLLEHDPLHSAVRLVRENGKVKLAPVLQ